MMENTKPKKFKGNGKKRDSGGFITITHHVLDSAAYRGLGYATHSLLIDIARQYTGTNNGRLVACSKYLAPRGWNSHATITKCLRELLESGLLIQTRLGMKPNRAAWFAIAWHQLDEATGIEITNAEFIRIKSNWKLKQPSPINGIGKQVIAPANGISPLKIVPINRVMP